MRSSTHWRVIGTVAILTRKHVFVLLSVGTVLHRSFAQYCTVHMPRRKQASKGSQPTPAAGSQPTPAADTVLMGERSVHEVRLLLYSFEERINLNLTGRVGTVHNLLKRHHISTVHWKISAKPAEANRWQDIWCCNRLNSVRCLLVL